MLSGRLLHLMMSGRLLHLMLLFLCLLPLVFTQPQLKDKIPATSDLSNSIRMNKLETGENAAAFHKSKEGGLMAVKTETQDTPSKLPMTVTLVSSSPGDQSSKRDNMLKASDQISSEGEDLKVTRVDSASADNATADKETQDTSSVTDDDIEDLIDDIWSETSLNANETLSNKESLKNDSSEMEDPSLDMNDMIASSNPINNGTQTNSTAGNGDATLGAAESQDTEEEEAIVAGLDSLETNTNGTLATNGSENGDNNEDFLEGSVGSGSEATVEGSGDEDEEATLLTIAEHLRNDPDILRSFRPSALRNVVMNPNSLAILPMPVLDELINDPIFSVELPGRTRELITELLMEFRLPARVGRVNEGSGEGSGEDDDYGDYGDYDLDYGDDVNGTVSSFIGDLDPEFLESLDPEIIVEYFENASPEDLQLILSNSTILLSLPAKTIGSLISKLNNDLLLQLLRSPAVADLYNNTALSNLSEDARTRFSAQMDEVAAQIVEQVEVSVLTEVPEFIVRDQLSNKRALTALLNDPPKLQAIVDKYGDLLNEIPPMTIVDIVRNDSMVLASIPTDLFTTLATCDVVGMLSSEFIPSELIENSTDKFVRLLIEKPDIIDCISDLYLGEFVKKAFDDAVFLDSNSTKAGREETTMAISRSIMMLADKSLLRLASREDIQDALPDFVIVDMINDRPNIVRLLPKSIIIKMAKTKPWLIGKMSMTAVMEFSKRQEVFMTLTDRDIANILAFQSGLLSVFATLPTDVLVMFMAVHIDLLDILPVSAKSTLRRVLQNQDLLRAIPTELHAKLAKKKIVQEIIDKYSLLDILEAHPYLVARLSPYDLKPFLRFLEDPWFRERLPCTAVRVASKDSALFDIVSDHTLATIISCRHILSCIERKDLEKLMATSNLGARLTLSTLIASARNLRLSQLSLRTALNFVTQQIPRSRPVLFFN